MGVRSQIALADRANSFADIFYRLPMRTFANLCVFCGSSTGSNPTHSATTKALAEVMVANDIGLVYGGGETGLMGLIADTVLDLGGRVTGIIPVAIGKEVAHRGITELIEVDTMHDRKAMMYERSDAFIAMPGGLGTLEEVAEVATWRQLGMHDKPVGLLDSDGYYTHLLAWMDRAVDDGLLKEKNRGLVTSSADPQELLDLLRNDTTAYEAKWE